MAKKNGVSKTQAVKTFFKKNPKASNQEAVDALAKEGITISTNYISNIKSEPQEAAERGEGDRCQGRNRRHRDQGGPDLHQDRG